MYKYISRLKHNFSYMPPTEEKYKIIIYFTYNNDIYEV